MAHTASRHVAGRICADSIYYGIRAFSYGVRSAERQQRGEVVAFADRGDMPRGAFLVPGRELASGGSVTLKAVILPAVSNAAITWTSSNPEVAVVSPTGMVTNLYPGTGSATATITASWNGLTSSCTIICQQAQHTGTVTNAENGLNVRSGPGSDYGRVGGLKADASVVVLGQQEGWYQVLFRNPDGQAAIGYVSAEYLTLNR